MSDRPPVPEVDARLSDAIERSDLDGARAALDAGASPNGASATPPLSTACFRAPALVPLLLERGADPNFAPNGTTALGYLFLVPPWEDDRSEDDVVRAIAALARAGARLDDPVRRDGAPAIFETVDRARSLRPLAALLDAGASIDARGPQDRTMLHVVAADETKTEILTLLLERGADVTLVDERGATALSIAAGASHWGKTSVAHVRALLGAGADPSHLDHDGVSPLAAALTSGPPALVEILRAAGARPGPCDGSLLGALAVSDEAAARAALGRADLSARSATQATPLLLACERMPVLVPELLRRGADPRAVDRSGETALHKIAGAGAGHPEAAVLDAARALLDAGLDPNALSARKATPLGRALSRQPNERVAVIELFLARGAKPGARDEAVHGGYTPLAIAAKQGKPDFVRALLAKKAKVDQKNAKEDLTPLLSIWRTSGGGDDPAGQIEALRVLLGAGADPNARDGRDGRTVLHRAAEKRDLEPARVLLAGGADPNAADRHGVTPLHRAAVWSWGTEMVRLLLSHGADASAADEKGKTPLDVVMESGRKSAEVRELLRAAGARPAAPPSAWRTYGVPEGDRAALVRAVEAAFGVELHPHVRRFVEDDVDPSGPLRLGRFSERFAERESFDRLFGRLGSGWFPAIRIGRQYGIDVWLMLESARIVALHHDATFSEVAAEIRARTTSKFVEEFVRRGSGLDLEQLLTIQRRARALGDRPTAEAFVDLVSAALGRSGEDVERALESDVRLEILREAVRALSR